MPMLAAPHPPVKGIELASANGLSWPPHLTNALHRRQFHTSRGARLALHCTLYPVGYIGMRQEPSL